MIFRDWPAVCLLFDLQHTYFCRAVYVGLGRGDAVISTKLFRWHELLVETKGVGSIMRILRSRDCR